MDSTAVTVRWPRAGSVVYAAGRFTDGERDFIRDYVNGELTLHLFTAPARICIAARTIAVEAGDVTIAPPGSELRFDFPRPAVHWGLRLLPVAGRQPGIDLPQHLRLGPWAGEARSRLEHIMEDHSQAAGRRDHPAAWAASLGAHALLCWLAARDGADAAAGRRRVEVALRRAEALLTSTTSAGLPIAEVARRAGMSQNRLAAAFADHHGMTMAQYRIRFLLRHAQWLMEASDWSLAAIRASIEIRDPHRFNKLFRRFTGMSPTAWRATRVPLITSSPRPPPPE